MTPSNQAENDIEDSSSSAGSFVHSMNLLSTAKDSSDSRDVSDLSSKREETSEESESDSSERVSPAPGRNAKNASRSPSNDEEMSALESPGKEFDASSQTTGKGKEHVNANASNVNSVALNQALGSLPTAKAHESKSTHLFTVGESQVLSHDANAEGVGQERPATATSAVQQSHVSSDHSVSHTVESSSSGSSQSDTVSVPQRPMPGSSSATGVLDGIGAAEKEVPVGHIRLTSKKHQPNLVHNSASHAKFHHGDASSAGLVPPASAPSTTGVPVISPAGPIKSKPASSLRRGKWTVEEEAYVARVINDFNLGLLNAPAGTTLRSYLSEKLHCDPMRITKKFTGEACIGKRVFHPAVRNTINAPVIDKAQAELDSLERRWRRRLEMQQRESAKKAAASAAAAAAAATGRTHLHSHVAHPSMATASCGTPQTRTAPPHSGGHHIKQTAVARTASWLDRANAILAANSEASPATQMQSSAPFLVPPGRTHVQDVRSLPQKEIEEQMKEVQRLIHEGPSIQQTTAGLPHLLDQEAATHSPFVGQRKVTDDLPHIASGQPPVDKRPRTSAQSSTGAEDAEALVGFLNSVRASAEATGNEFST